MPGTVTVSGTVAYTDRNGAAGRPAGYINVQVWDQEADGSWHWLEEKSADNNGHFQFDPRENWDDDPGDPDHRLDLYLQFETIYNRNQANEQKVTKVDDSTYIWPIDPLGGSYTRWNVNNGNFSVSKALPSRPDERAKAIWLFEDLMRAYWTVPGDPQSGHIHWEAGRTCIDVKFGVTITTVCDSAFFLPLLEPYGIFIPDLPETANSQDTVVHEIAHQYMSNTNGFWYPFDGGYDDYQACVLNEHHYFDNTTDICAYTEGWADFVAVAVNQSLDVNDVCFDWVSNHCAGNSQNIETPARGDGNNEGDTVEGRVAGSLWDLYDPVNEDYDHSSVGWSSIWGGQRATGPFTFRGFWDTWANMSQTNGVYNKHNAVQSIYQNSIDYDNSPVFSPPLPDITVLAGIPRENAINLCNFVTDAESKCQELRFEIAMGCGPTIHNQHIDVPAMNVGGCDILVGADDGLKMTFDLFHLTIAPVRGRVFLPIIINSTGGQTLMSSPQLPEDGQSSPNPAYPAPMNKSNITRVTPSPNSQAYPSP